MAGRPDVEELHYKRYFPDSRTDKPVQALVFNCFGTLVDTTSNDLKAWIRACLHFNIEVEASALASLAEQPPAQQMRTLGVTEDQFKAAVEFKTAALQCLNREKLPVAIKPVVAIASWAAAKGLPIALVSDASEEVVDRALAACHLRGKFRVLSCGQRLDDKQCYVEAASKLGVAPEAVAGYTLIHQDAMRAAGYVLIETLKGFTDYPHGQAQEHEEKERHATHLRAAVDALSAVPSQPPSFKPLSRATSARDKSRVMLRLIQVTDVYILDNFPALRTMLTQYKANVGHKGKAVSMLTGDFLQPYLLSQLDDGLGMMSCINAAGIDYLTWGNHDIDNLAHEKVMQRVHEFKGTFINTNFTAHPSSKERNSTEAEVIEVRSPDGTNVRRVALLGILTVNGYKKMKKGEKFAGTDAVISDKGRCEGMLEPDEAYELFKKGGAKRLALEKEHGPIDVVIPLEHMYVDQNRKTAAKWGSEFPVILAGHDHFVCDELVEGTGTLLLKAGQDGHMAVVLDLVWDGAELSLEHEIVSISGTDEFVPDSDLQEIVKLAYSPIRQLENATLCNVPSSDLPFSGAGARGLSYDGKVHSRTTVGTFLCSALRDALSTDTKHLDLFFIKGGNLKSDRNYAEDANGVTHFAMATLRDNLGDRPVFVSQISGSELEKLIQKSHRTPGKACWLQWDDGVEVDDEHVTKTADGGYSGCVVLKIRGQPLKPEYIYNVGSLVDFHKEPQSIPDFTWFTSDKKRMPEEESGISTYSLIVKLFQHSAWEANAAVDYAAKRETLLRKLSEQEPFPTGHAALDPKSTAVLAIEFQNEFAAKGGIMYPQVAKSMEQLGMLEKSKEVVATARAMGCKIVHIPVLFDADGSNIKQSKVGILASCKAGSLFQMDTWNSKYVDGMKPQSEDIEVKKCSLDSFVGTDLKDVLEANAVQTVVLTGFLTSCCVESTMRSAYERGFDVITLTDCTADVTAAAHKSSTEGTFKMFSTPMTAAQFLTDCLP